jgi:hypothetical protein
LRSIDWETEMAQLNVEDSWLIFKNSVLRIAENHIPKSKPVRQGSPRWLTREIKTLINRKKKAWKKYKHEGGLENKSDYDSIAKSLKKAVRNAKKKYEKELAYA